MINAKNDKSLVVKYTILAVCLCFNVFAVFTLLFGEHSISAWKNDNEILLEMKNDLALLAKENEELSTKIRLLNTDNDYLEKKIRQQLNYVKKSEVLYIFEDQQNSTYWQEASE